MKALKIAAFLLIMMTLASCEYLHNLVVDDEVVDATYPCGTIKTVVVNAPCRIILIDSASTSIDGRGHQYLMDELAVYSANDSLVINHPQAIYMQKSKLITLRVPARNLVNMIVNSAVELQSADTIHVPKLNVVVNGRATFTETDFVVACNALNLSVYGNNNIGNYHLGGTAQQLSVVLEGSVNVDASALDCQNVSVNHKSIGKCNVWVDKLLKVNTYSSGDTYYKGDPEIEQKVINVSYLTASGKVIQIN